MGKLIYRSEKVNTAGEVSGREHEANRTEADIGKFQNSDIDWELTNQNYDFKITNGWVDAVKEKCAELGCTVKKDSVLVIDHLITASPEWLAEQTEETKMQFFTDAKDWIVKEFCGGDESLLLNARIHKDESNWHLCAATIPIKKNQQRSEEELAQLKRKPRQKEYSLSAKSIMGGRGDYSRRQQSIEDAIGKKYGLEAREVREQGEAKKHQTVQQAKLNALKQQVEKMEQVKQSNQQKFSDHLENCKKRGNQETAKVKELVAEREALQKEVAELKQEIAQLYETPGLKERMAEAQQRVQIENEARSYRKLMEWFDGICLGQNQYGERYTLADFVKETRKHSENKLEFINKMTFVLLNLHREPINDLFQFVRDKGRLAELKHTWRDRDD